MLAIIVDDDPLIINLLKKILENLGFEVEAYENPIYCRLYYKHECTNSKPCCDLLLTDYEMPMVNGVEFIRHLECHGCAINKIALVSGLSKESIAEKEDLTGLKVINKFDVFNELRTWAKDD